MKERATYHPRLTDAFVREATRQTHGIWASGRALADHTAHTLEQLHRAGPELLRYVGLVKGGGLVASIKRYSLLLARGSTTMRAVGIGAVFVPKSQRGNRYAEQLIGDVLDEARDLGYAAAYLYSDIAPEFYERLGFVATPSLHHTIDLASLPDHAALALRPARAGDLDAMIDLHRSRSRALRQARTRSIWRYFSWRSEIDGQYVIVDGDRVAGYVVAGVRSPRRDLPGDADPRELWLDEWSAPGIETADVFAAIRALAKRKRCARVAAWLAPTDDRRGWTEAPRTEAIGMIATLERRLRIDAKRDFLASFEHF